MQPSKSQVSKPPYSNGAPQKPKSTSPASASASASSSPKVTNNDQKNNDDNKNNTTSPSSPSSSHTSNSTLLMTNLLNLKLSPIVKKKLREVIPSTDPLDDVNFNVLNYVNGLFPTEESLGDVNDGKLSRKINDIRNQVNNIDINLSKSVQLAAKNRFKTQSAIKETQQSIQELFKKVKSIKDKAIQSEHMVEEICSDIRKLDNAKKNLSGSITTLQKLHMLVSGVQQLQKDSDTKSYDRASHLVQALDDLFKHFKDYLSLTQLKSLKLDMDKTREELKKSIYRDFRKYNPKTVIDPGAVTDSLRNACDVIDVMGDNERDLFIEWISSTQLQAYGAIFSPGGNNTGIDNIEKRFEWLKNQLLKYNKNYSFIFPKYWNIPGFICKEFCDITRNHLIEILKSSQLMNNLDINNLVRALEQCVLFEKELNRLYNKPIYNDELEIQKKAYINTLGDYREQDLDKPPRTSDKIKIKYKIQKIKENIAKIELKQAQENTLKSSDQKEKEKTISEINFIGILSSAFNKYMHYYVSLEKKSISELLSDIESNEEWDINVNNIPNEQRYAGIDDLLGYIKKSIERCNKIGTGEIFYKIYYEYRDGIKLYIDMLDRRVVIINNLISSNNNSKIYNSLISLCLIVNTLDYLSDTLKPLESRLCDCFSGNGNDKYIKKINFEDIREGKSDDLAVKTVKCISQNIVVKIGNILDREISSSRKWNEQDQSVERSSFLLTLKLLLNNNISICHELLIMSYHNLLNSQLTQRLIPKYISSIFNKIKRISNEGALQLQLDTRDFEKTLLNLPNIGLISNNNNINDNQSNNDNNNDNQSNNNNNNLYESTKDLIIHPNYGKNIRIPNSFKNYIRKEINKIQSLLKTIGINYLSPSDIAQFYKDVSNIKSKYGNYQDLIKICEIKGLKKNEIQNVIQIYNKIIPINNQQTKPLINVQTKKSPEENLKDIFGGIFGR